MEIARRVEPTNEAMVERFVRLLVLPPRKVHIGASVGSRVIGHAVRCRKYVAARWIGRRSV